MISIDLHELIVIVPDLTNLFLSGFIFIKIYNWLTNAQIDTYIIGIWSLFISSFIKAICSAIHGIFFVSMDFNEGFKIVIYVVAAVLLSVSTVAIRNSKEFKKLLHKITDKTVNKDILDDVIDRKKRTMMLVYPKDSDIYYSGAFRLYEEKGSDSYIVLINYALCNKSDDEIIRDCSEQKSSILFNLQDIERIELFYETDSEVWKDLNKYNQNNEE